MNLCDYCNEEEVEGKVNLCDYFDLLVGTSIGTQSGQFGNTEQFLSKFSWLI